MNPLYEKMDKTKRVFIANTSAVAFFVIIMKIIALAMYYKNIIFFAITAISIMASLPYIIEFFYRMRGDRNAKAEQQEKKE
jgi:hypothetical protein